jgi:flagellar hook protein FlgE
MASTTAFFTGLSGLASNSARLDVIGNNIANVNTAAFKGSRMMFAPMFSQTYSMGTSPTSQFGGTNPIQAGMGSSIAGIQRSFAQGAISATGIMTDMAIEGQGFFVVQQGSERFFTRDGSFLRNENNDLISMTGARVMGYAVDDKFNIVEGQLTELNLPLGTLTLAEATRHAIFNGNLNASGEVATTGSVHTSSAFFVNDPAMDPANLMGSDFLDIDLTVAGNDLYISDGSGGSYLAFESGAQAKITISGVEKGGQDLGEVTFGFMTAEEAEAAGVDAYGSTMNDYFAFLEDVLGLNDDASDGQSLGGSVALNAEGQVVISGNEGTAQSLSVETADFVVTYDGTPVGEPINQAFVMTETAEADGESVRTSFVVYDSLGEAVTVDLTMVLQETTDGEGTIWKYIAESTGDADLDRVIGSGILKFDGNGTIISQLGNSIHIDRDNGAVSPLTVEMDFDAPPNVLTSLADTASYVANVAQDGSPIGTLASFAVGQDGMLIGGFTNGLTRTIGQIALATFANPSGLSDAGNNLYQVAPNSGEAVLTRAGEFGTGRILGGALELSNVDLSEEFVNMILASTGYSAASRVITTSNDLMEQLLVLGR